MSFTEQQIKAALSAAVDPNTGKDFVAGKALKNVRIDGSDVSFDIELGYPAKTQIDAIRAIAANFKNLKAVVEKVGFHRQGNSATASCKFARHVGHIEAALYTCGIPFVEVTPHKWMAAIGTMPADKKARKNAIKEEMARRFPHLMVTLGVADALGILCWARNQS